MTNFSRISRGEAVYRNKVFTLEFDARAQPLVAMNGVYP